MSDQKAEAIRIQAGQRNYFLDVKEAKTGSKYLILTESRKNKDGKFDRQRIIIFKEGLTPVLDALRKVAPELGVNI